MAHLPELLKTGMNLENRCSLQGAAILSLQKALISEETQLLDSQAPMLPKIISLIDMGHTQLCLRQYEYSTMPEHAHLQYICRWAHGLSKNSPVASKLPALQYFSQRATW